MNIGLKIKQLRQKQNLTQEDLGEMLSISSKSISRWELGITYPDISLLPIIANIFKITTDELLEVDIFKQEERVKDIIKKTRDCGTDYEKAFNIIKNGRKDYPNNYQILDKYLFYLIGGIADNDNDLIINNEEEVINISNFILNGCNDEIIRLNALNYKAKVLYARGDKKGAIELLNSFPSFYQASNQKIEQLYNKDTKEFYDCLKKNISELTSFLGNKIGKQIFYNDNLSDMERIDQCIDYYNLAKASKDTTIIKSLVKSLLIEAINRSKQLNFDNNFVMKLEQLSNDLSK